MLRKEIERKEAKWKKEKDALKGKIRRMDEKLKRVELHEDWKREIELKIETMKNGIEEREMIEKLRKIKKMLERNEIKERRRNIIIKGTQLTEGNEKEKVEQLLQKKLNFKGTVESRRKIKLGMNNEAVILRLPSIESKKTIIEKTWYIHRRQSYQGREESTKNN